jgi:hypothetical protein
MRTFLSNIDLSDILICIGCILLGYGLFLLKGLGFSLAVIGAIFLILGILGSIPVKKPDKG